jgi:drug/metabolite transporter (DMT)-like permease
MLQTAFLTLYIALFERTTFLKMWLHRKLVTSVGITSCIGSIGWFSAMSLQQVAYVKTLGQLEIFFMLGISIFWLKKPLKKNDFLGLCLIALAAILVMLT